MTNKLVDYYFDVLHLVEQKAELNCEIGDNFLVLKLELLQALKKLHLLANEANCLCIYKSEIRRK